MNTIKTNIDELNSSLKRFRDISIDLKSCIENEDYNSMGILLNRRQEIIDGLSLIDYKKEDFIKVCDKYGIIQLQNEVKNLMDEKKVKVRSEIEKMKSSQNANKNYVKKFAADSIFFNKKI